MEDTIHKDSVAELVRSGPEAQRAADFVRFGRLFGELMETAIYPRLGMVMTDVIRERVLVDEGRWVALTLEWHRLFEDLAPDAP